MARIVLFEDDGWRDLLPLVYWRGVADLRVGGDTLGRRIARRLGTTPTGVWVRDWIAPAIRARQSLPVNEPLGNGTSLVNARWIPPEGFRLPDSPCVGICADSVAFIISDPDRQQPPPQPTDTIRPDALPDRPAHLPRVDAPGHLIRYPWDLLAFSADCLANDPPPDEPSAALDALICPPESPDVHVARTAQIHPTAILDPHGGPIVIRENARVGPYCVIEGPAYIGPGTVLNAHAHLHGPNAIGPWCKLGGEIDGCLIQGYTNKQHAGFLGHACVGEWVNLGAGTSNSDLKNTYGSVRVPIQGRDVDTGQQFFGAVIGDHVKTGINTSIPTGAVLGFAALAAVSTLLPKFLPSFAWLTDRGLDTGDPARLATVAGQVMKRRQIAITEPERALFQALPDLVRGLEPPTQT